VTTHRRYSLRDFAAAFGYGLVTLQGWARRGVVPPPASHYERPAGRGGRIYLAVPEVVQPEAPVAPRRETAAEKSEAPAGDRGAGETTGRDEPGARAAGGGLSMDTTALRDRARRGDARFSEMIALCDEVDRLRARVAELEAERDAPLVRLRPGQVAITEWQGYWVGIATAGAYSTDGRSLQLGAAASGQWRVLDSDAGTVLASDSGTAPDLDAAKRAAEEAVVRLARGES